MKNLRETIRRVILNEAKFAELGRLCLYKTRYHPDEKVYVLFRPELIDELISKGTKITYDIAADVAKSSDNFIGGVQIQKWGIEPGCYGAWEVTKAIAQDGFGPVLYDIAMADNPEGIFADRSSVTDAAYDMWNFYHKKRYDVDALPMDDVEKNWTDSAEDDCYWGSSGEHYRGDPSNPDLSHQDFLSDPLNYVYRRKPMMAMKSLKLRSEKHLSRLRRAFPGFQENVLWSFMLEAKFWGRSWN